MNDTPLFGKHVELSGDNGPLRSCPTCGSATGKIHSGQGPHAASVRCDKCNRFLGWLSHRAVSLMIGETAHG